MAVSDPLVLGIGDLVVTIGEGASVVPAGPADTSSAASIPGPAPVNDARNAGSQKAAALSGSDAVAGLAGRFTPERLLEFSEALKRFGEALMLQAVADLDARDAEVIRADLADLRRSSEGMAASLGTGRLIERAPDEALAQQIAQVRDVSRYGAARDVERARLLCTDLPEPFEALASGRLGALHARNIVDLAARIPAADVPVPVSKDPAALEEAARQRAEAGRVQRQRRQVFCADVLQRSGGKTPGQVEGFGKRRLERELGEPFAARHRSARKGRRVELHPEDDGMCYLSAYLPTLAGEAIMRRLEDYARLQQQTPARHETTPDADRTAAQSGDHSSVRSADRTAAGSASSGAAGDEDADGEEPEPRTLSQLMADALVDVLLNGPAGAGLENVVPHVVLTVPAELFPSLGTTAPETTSEDTTGQDTAGASATADAGLAAEGSDVAAGPREGAGRGWANGSDRPYGSESANALVGSYGPAGSGPGASAGDQCADGLTDDPAAVVPSGSSPPTAEPPTVVPSEAGNASGRCSRPVPVAEVERLGPVDPHSLRQVLGAAPTWTRIVTDPWTGAIRAFDPEAYRPPAAVRRALALRDRTCRVPGCGRRATACEPDHILEWQHGGRTRMENLVSLCKRCHRLKSWGLITCEMTPGGTLTVTTHLGTPTTTYPDATWAVDGPTSAPTTGPIANDTEGEIASETEPTTDGSEGGTVAAEAAVSAAAAEEQTTVRANRFPVPARLAGYIKASPRPWTPDHQRMPDPTRKDETGVDWDTADLVVEPGIGTPLPLWGLPKIDAADVADPLGWTRPEPVVPEHHDDSTTGRPNEDYENFLEHLTADLMRDLLEYLEPAPF
ncbi:DUF222 domain-containing protein [Zhihengliuella sp.]|uniref:HNH endonuclease n=1 Tax=Zhihengliuella sp. TaxID=1954483 RepID=UPI0028121D68|nr:DUF222 domain-containing protein [Zhihengliuella sp.]